MKIVKLVGYYTLQWTWGIITNIFGFFCLIVGLICRNKITKFGPCVCIESKVLHNCGFEAGMFFVTSENAERSLKQHEAGHSLQNILWGPLFLFVISIPSCTRFWYRKWKRSRGQGDTLPPYDSIWFESQASAWGSKYF